MRDTRKHNQQRFGATAVALLLLSCAVVILACSGSAGDLVEATPTTTGAAGATAAATSSAAALTPTAIPPKPTSTPKPKPPTATPVPFHVTSVSVSVSPSHYTGGCVDVTMTFTYTFKLLANGPGGTISFYTYGPDGPPSGTITVKAKAGQTTVTMTDKVDYDQETIFADESPWIQLQTTKPNKVTSNKANYVFTCIS
jgi:hypothetical protein